MAFSGAVVLTQTCKILNHTFRVWILLCNTLIKPSAPGTSHVRRVHLHSKLFPHLKNAHPVPRVGLVACSEGVVAGGSS